MIAPSWVLVSPSAVADDDVAVGVDIEDRESLCETDGNAVSVLVGILWEVEVGKNAVVDVGVSPMSFEKSPVKTAVPPVDSTMTDPEPVSTLPIRVKNEVRSFEKAMLHRIEVWYLKISQMESSP
jgi:hypothetical protein